MPFQSKSQLQTCFNKQIRGRSSGSKSKWDCQEILRKTRDPRCLPYRTGGESHTPCRTMRANEKIVGKIQQGPRGGYFFMAAGVKVYVPKGSDNLAAAKKLYGSSRGRSTTPKRRTPAKSAKRSSTKRRTPAKKAKSAKKRTSAKKSRSAKKKTPAKKSRSAKKKAPTKKAKSAKKRTSVKKSKSAKKKTPAKKSAKKKSRSRW